MAEATQPVGPRWPDPAALLDLIDDLRTAGYNLDLTHYLAAQDLLLALAARGEMLDPPQRLQGLLGPLLCSSPAEQAEFPHHFAQWAARLPQAIEPTPQPAVTTSSLEEELVAIDRQARWGRWVLLTVYIFLFSSLLQTSHPPMPSVGPLPTLVATIAVNPVEPTPTAGNATIVPAPNPVEPASADATLFEQGRRLLWRWQTLVGLVLLLAPWLTWRLWWFYRAHLFLVRHATTQTPELEKVVVQSSTTALFSPLALFRLAQELRRRVEIPSRELDIEAALTITIQQAGWFTPVYGRRRLVPEYLILVDRAHYHDHQARLVEELMQRLQAYEVQITRYAFNGDPRICFPLAGKGAPLTLRDLAAKHPDQRLILFADVHTLFSPFTGELEPWVAQLLHWPERVLLTPEVATNWGYREQELAQQFSVLPATPAGLAQLVQSLIRPRIYTDSDNNAQARLPEALRTRPLRWLERQSPEAEQVETLLADLRTYLDETGFTWLCACAVYPAIDWNLTLYLGQALQTDEGAFYLEPNRLLTLARLPWLRYGYMPDWLRSELLNSLSHPQNDAIRFTLQTLLVTAVQGEPVGFPLEIARRHRRGLRAMAKPLLHLLIRKANEDSLLRDYIFVQFMIGSRPLALQLPQFIGDLLGKPEHSDDEYIKPLSRESVETGNAPLAKIFCPRCGTVNRAEARYCRSCGVNLTQSSTLQPITEPGSLPDNHLLNDRYSIITTIAQGSMSAVYNVVDNRQPGKVWAIKEMSLENLDRAEIAPAIQDFHREADLLSKLDHPNLVRVIDRFSISGKEYMVMEYIQGETLEDKLRTGVLPEEEVLGIAFQLCDVLEYLHQQAPPIIYRDLKPGNIMIESGSGLIKLIDFSIARFYKPGQRKDTKLLGTPGFAPPEQYGKGQTDARSDIFALGVTLLVLLTAYDVTQNPWAYPPARQLNAQVSKHLEQVILKATNLKVQERYQSMAEVRNALKSRKGGREIFATLPSTRRKITTDLGSVTFHELVGVLTPYMATDQERQALLRLALPNTAYRLIHFHGPAKVFTTNMVNTLLQYGEIGPGKQAIVALVDVIYDQVGPNNQVKIDQLRQQLMAHFQQGSWVACPNCGTSNRPTAKFCRLCGQELVATPRPVLKVGRRILFSLLSKSTARLFIFSGTLAIIITVVAIAWLFMRNEIVVLPQDATTTATFMIVETTVVQPTATLNSIDATATAVRQQIMVAVVATLTAMSTQIPDSVDTLVSTTTLMSTSTPTPDFYELIVDFRRAERAALQTLDTNVLAQVPVFAHGEALAAIQQQVQALRAAGQYEVLIVEDVQVEQVMPGAVVGVLVNERHSRQTFERSAGGDHLLAQEVNNFSVIYGFVEDSGRWKIDKALITNSPTAEATTVVQFTSTPNWAATETTQSHLMETAIAATLTAQLTPIPPTNIPLPPPTQTSAQSSVFFRGSVKPVCTGEKNMTWFEGTVYVNNQPANGYQVVFKSYLVPGDEPATTPAISGPHVGGYTNWPNGYYAQIVNDYFIKKHLEIWIINDAGQAISDRVRWDSDGPDGPCNKAMIDFFQ